MHGDFAEGTTHHWRFFCCRVGIFVLGNASDDMIKFKTEGPMVFLIGKQSKCKI